MIHISLLTALPLCLPAPLPPAPPQLPVDEIRDGMSDEEMATHMDGWLAERVKRMDFSGVVLIAREGEPFYEKVYGLASRRFDVPNRIDTKFNLGSMNKMFTALSICQLAELGKLSFDDLLIEHLPDYPNPEVAGKVTLHHLLTHTSGMGSFWAAMENVNPNKLRNPADHLSLFAADPLHFEPGERFSYSNSGFLVLGLVIEAVSGQSYYDYVREQIFDVVGMIGTDSYPLDEPVKNLAIGYTAVGPDGHPGEDGRVWNNYYSHRIRGGPAGGGFSTAHDLLRFATGLLNYDLLEPELTQTLIDGKVNARGLGARYAYGFIDRSVQGVRAVGHSGGAPGINAVMRTFPGLGYTMVVMSNVDGGASPIGEHIQEMIVRSIK